MVVMQYLELVLYGLTALLCELLGRDDDHLCEDSLASVHLGWPSSFPSSSLEPLRSAG